MAVLLLLRQREKGAEDRWHLLLDVGHDDVAELRPLPCGLHGRVDPREDDDRLRARIRELMPELGWRARRRSSSSRGSTDRKSTRLNSSHQIISYTVFCFKNK